MITIYIASYLKSQLPSLASIIFKDTVNGEQPNFICVIDNGFVDVPLVLRRNFEFQILIQSTNEQTAKENAYAVYGILSEKYNFDLPTPADTTNDPLHIDALIAIQAPASLGSVKNRYQYTINYTVSANQTQPQQV